MIYIVFGKCGAGKTYISKLLAEEMGCKHIEADDWLTEEMKELIVNRKPITEKAVDNYVEVIIKELKNLVKNTQQDIVVSQALFLSKHRLKIRNSLPDNCQFIQAEASAETIAKRISNAERFVVDANYAKEMNKNFQTPTNLEKYITIYNDTDGKDKVIKQWQDHMRSQ